ncbi:MAG: hypothetical protein KGZ43_08795 [Sulfuritalea sp.]|nr:hypothetical protein [Sulfuritalea sp.]
MKINPFSKKSTAYYDKAKTEYDKLDRELKATENELKEAEADHERKQRRHHELRQHGSMYSSTQEEKKASFEASAAGNRVFDIKSRIGQLRSRIAPLQRIACAPDQFAQARKRLDELVAQDKALTAEREKTDALITKVGKRLAGLEERLAAETKSATATLLDDEGEFVVPESLTRLEAELRLAKASLADLQGKREALLAQLGSLPKAIGSARNDLIHHRAVVAEIELYEQLMPVMTVVARASAARRETSYSHDESRFEIEIPRELIEVAEAALAAELPAA